MNLGLQILDSVLGAASFSVLAGRACEMGWEEMASASTSCKSYEGLYVPFTINPRRGQKKAPRESEGTDLFLVLCFVQKVNPITEMHPWTKL